MSTATAGEGRRGRGVPKVEGQVTEAVSKLSKDLRKAAATLTEREVRYLVDSYYAIQDFRIQAAAQAREAGKAGEPHEISVWLFDQMERLENEVKKSLGDFADSKRAGRWLLSQYGIGPVIAAGLLAHVDPAKAVTAGALWRFAGLDPTSEWLGKEKGAQAVKDALQACGGDIEAAVIVVSKRVGCREDSLRRFASTDVKGNPIELTQATLSRAAAKRPWNAKLKTLCWKIGDSFVKFSGQEDCVYGKIYREAKAKIVAADAMLEYAECAKATLEKKKFADKDTRTTYESGHLPAGRLDLRARRHAVKLFLSHFQTVLFESTFNKPAPAPWVIAFGGHKDLIVPPGWPCE